MPEPSSSAATQAPAPPPHGKGLSQAFSASNKTKSHVGPWRLGRTLGRGSSGRVRLAKHSVTGKLAAVKIVPKSSFDTISYNISDKAPYGIEREIIIMKLIQHPNVMGLYDVWENKGELYLVLEYIEGGELFDYLVAKGRLEENEAIKYFRQIIHGVDYCHKFNICHRDLKPENILLDNGIIKIADFGMAALETAGKMLETSCGSPHYASPEIVAGKAYHGAPSDIWSCGIILFALLTGHLPFDDDNIRKLLFKVQEGRFAMPLELSVEAKDLIWKMLQVDPKQRISMPEILNHPLLSKYPDKKQFSMNPYSLVDSRMVKRPVKSPDDIDLEILKNLQTLWHGATEESLIESLLSDEMNSEKTFYCLLVKYRHDHIDSDEILGNTPRQRGRDPRSHRSQPCTTPRSRSRSKARSKSRSHSRLILEKSKSSSHSVSKLKASSKDSSSTENEIPAVPKLASTYSLALKKSAEFASMVEHAFESISPNLDEITPSTPCDTSPLASKAKLDISVLDSPTKLNFDDPPSSPDLFSPSTVKRVYEADRFADAVEDETTLHMKRSLESDSDTGQARKLFLENPPSKREIKPLYSRRQKHSHPKIKAINEEKLVDQSIPHDPSFVESRLHISDMLKTEEFKPKLDDQLRTPVTYVSPFGADTPFTMTSTMQLKLSNPGTAPIVEKPLVRMNQARNSDSPTVVSPIVSSAKTKAGSPKPVLKSKGLFRKFALGSRKSIISETPRAASAQTTSSYNSSTPTVADSSLSELTRNATRPQSSISTPKSNWFSKLLSSNKTDTKGFYSLVRTPDLRRTILMILSEWQRYGISNITEKESLSGCIIRAKVSSSNVLMVRSSRFQIEIGPIGPIITTVLIIRERGSSSTFTRFLGELERELELRNVLFTSNPVEPVAGKSIGILV